MSKQIDKEREYIRRKFYSNKAIVLNILTFGFYGWANCFAYVRRVGLY